MKNQDQPECINVLLPPNKGMDEFKLKSLDELPWWFKKENYDFSSCLSAREWLDELLIRAFYYSLQDVTKNYDLAHYERSIRNYRSKSNFFGICIRSIREINSLHEILKSKSNSHFSTDNDPIFFGSTKNLKKLICDVTEFSPTYTFGFRGIFKKDLHLNLMSPDKCLIDHYLNVFEGSELDKFKAWMAKARESWIVKHPNTPIPFKKQIVTDKFKIQRLDESQLRGFYECGLLPFLDLHQWRLLNNVYITQDLMAEAVLPIPQKTGSSRLGENTQSKGENILAIIEVLFNQVCMDHN